MKYKKISDDELIKAFKKARTSAGTARKLGTCLINTQNRLKKLGLKRIPHSKYTPETLGKMYLKCGGNYTAMAREFGTTHSGIWQEMKKNGMYETHPAKGRK